MDSLEFLAPKPTFNIVPVTIFHLMVPPFPSREWRQLGNGAAILSHARTEAHRRTDGQPVLKQRRQIGHFSGRERKGRRREANVKFLTHYRRARSHLGV